MTMQATRLDPILRPYSKISVLFTNDASGNWWQQTLSREAFTRGVDDAGLNFNEQGYSDIVSSNNAAGQVEIASVYKGGAFSINNEVLVNAISVMPEGLPRISIASTPGAFNASEISGGAYTPTPTIGGLPNLLITRAGGAINDSVIGIADRLYTACLHSLSLQILPPNATSGCPIFLGIPQLMNSGTGFQNSGVTGFGFPSPQARYVLGEPVIVEPNRQQDSNYNPNGILFNWQSPLGSAVGSVTASVFKRASDPIMPLGSVICVDLICIADIAEVNVTSQDPNGYPIYEGVNPIDKYAIECFLKAV